MFTKDEIDNYKKIQERISDFGEEYVEEFCHQDSSFDMAYIEDDNIEIRSTSFYCGTSDTEYNVCPIEYLYDEFWIQTERDKRTAANLKALKKRSADLKREKKEREETRYKHYLEMKKEYESGEE